MAVGYRIDMLIFNPGGAGIGHASTGLDRDMPGGLWRLETPERIWPRNIAFIETARVDDNIRHGLVIETPCRPRFNLGQKNPVRTSFLPDESILGFKIAVNLHEGLFAVVRRT